MRKFGFSGLFVLAALSISACQPAVDLSEQASSNVDSGADKTITLLFTNDVESAYDPIPAFWLDDMVEIGGIAEMTTLIRELRLTEPNVFLFDSGDILTGALAKLTQGRLAFELMITMGYDAMAIGNHEFEYGHEIFAWQKNRAPFPVLGANFFYKDTDHPYAQAHAIIERGGLRIGVIGIMGQDAVTAIIPSFIAPLDVTDPVAAVQKSVDEIRDEVDLLVVLTHLGYLQLTLDGETGAIKDYTGRLIPVDPAKFAPDTKILAKLERYRNAHPEIKVKIGNTAARMNRLYIEESDVGHLFADAFVEMAGTDIGFIHSGSLRKDLPAGDVLLVDLLDTYPFVDDVMVKEMSGAQIRRAIEQSLTLERGLLQVSGLKLTYDMSQPEGQRLVKLERNGHSIANSDQFTVAVPGFISEGGDMFDVFAESDVIGNAGTVVDVMVEYFKNHELVVVPAQGRQVIHSNTG